MGLGKTVAETMPLDENTCQITTIISGKTKPFTQPGIPLRAFFSRATG